MKLIQILLSAVLGLTVLLLSPVRTLASETAIRRVNCTATIVGQKPAFTLEYLSSKRLTQTSPVVGIPDASFFEYSSEGDMTRVCFSNECDNMYCFAFFSSDLDSFASAEHKQLTGILQYSNGTTMFEQAANPSFDGVRTTSVSCQ